MQPITPQQQGRRQQRGHLTMDAVAEGLSLLHQERQLNQQRQMSSLMQPGGPQAQAQDLMGAFNMGAPGTREILEGLQMEGINWQYVRSHSSRSACRPAGCIPLAPV